MYAVMPKRSRQKAPTFNPSCALYARAAQAWQILVGKAMNRQTLTYEALSELMYRRKASGVLGKILGHIAFYCSDHDLPPLTTIVVNKASGLSGEGIPVNPSELDSERERVYAFDWYNIIQPSFQDLGDAYAAH
jgi:hypothetical protein